MKKATDIKLTEQKNDKGKVESYVVFCVVHDDSTRNGKRNISFAIDEKETKKLPKAKAESDKAIGVLIKKGINQHHAIWIKKEAADKVKKKDEFEGDNLEQKVGFRDLSEGDFT